jgi:2,5-diamino-6-(ribosylamino)-4(3H)-pyrimidinone 5'-phosphate reductase
MDRPFVFINVAMSADGKIDSFERRGATLSSARDKDRVDRLRASADAVMVGGRTLLDEDPRLTVKSAELRAERELRGLPPNPVKVGIVSRANLRPDSEFLNAGPARVLLFTSVQTSAAQVETLQACGAEVFLLGERRVDLEAALSLLKELDLQRLMVEGGATLNFELLRLGLVDEMTVYLAPLVLGGENAPTLAGGPGLVRIDALPLSLVSAETWDDGGVLLHYQIS